MNEKLLKRFISVVSTFSLLANSYIAPLAVLAQELSPTPEPTPIVEETTSSTTEPTQIPEETISPTTEPTQTPEETVLPTEVSAEVKTEQTEEPTQSNESVDSSPTAISSTTPEVGVVTTENTELNVNLLENTSSTSINEFDFSIQQDGSATLITDKADYAPTDTALITGSGFLPNKEYTIEITSTTGNFLFSDKVTSDESGGLFYTYQLDGTYRPDYKVEVKDGNLIISSVTFTDSIVYSEVVDSSGANDEPGQKDLTKLGRDLSSSNPLNIFWNWDEISMSGSNTADGCALFDTNNTGLVDYALCVTWGGTQNQISGSPKLYSCNDTRVDRCAGSVAITTPISSVCTVANASNDPFPAGSSSPNDTRATCTIPLSDVGNASQSSLLDVCSYPSTQPNSDPSDCIIIRADKGNLTIIKNVVPDNAGTNWNFGVSGPTAYSTSITGDGSSGITPVDLGTYSIVETAGASTSLDDYSTSWSCIKNGVTYLSGTGATASNIIISKDGNTEDSVVCTFTNTKKQGTLRVVKTVVNDNGGTKTSSNFSFQVNGGIPTAFEADGTNDLTVIPGNYSVTEPSVTGYATTYDNCTNINVVSNQTATCTITNNDIQPKLTVTKIVNGGDMQISDFSLFVGTTGVTSDVQNGFNVGNYTVSETNKSGYTSAITGDCLANGSISLVLGDVKSCTITNTRDTGSITIDKITLPTNDITDFNFNILSTDTGVDQDFNLEDQDTPFTSIFDTGIYTIEEKSIPTGWSLSSLACDQSATIDLINKKVTFDLDKGEDIKCTFTNTKLPTLTVNKILSPVGHGGFDLMIDGVVKASNVGDGGTTGANIVTVGNHIISETNGNPSTVMGDYIFEFGGDCDVDGKITLAAGENGVCTITNTAYGSLTIIKDSIPNDAQDFSFTTTGTGLSSFNLDDDSDSTLSNTKMFLHVTPGLYSVSETDVTGWDLTSATCSDGSSLDSINIAAGENVTCTFTNTKLGKIIIEKQTLPDGSLESFDFVSDYDVNGFSLTDGQQNESGYLLPGSYSVDENTPSGWDMGYSCSDESTKDSINLQAGEIVTCTFTNTQRGSIYGYKYEDSDGSNSTTTDRTAVAGWTIELWNGLVKVGEAITGADGKFTFSDLVFGNYKLIEQTISGWFNVTSDSLDLTLDPGENDGPNNFVNFEKAKIVVHKNVFGPFGTDVADSTSFPVFLDGSTERSVAEGSTTTYLDLIPGTYTITEGTLPTGYKFDSMTDDGVVTITSGGEFHIYIINSQLPAKLTVIKHVENDDGGILNASDFTMTVTGTDVQNSKFQGDESGTTVDLGAGDYSVDEYGTDGYSKSLSTDCTGTINFGETKTCTVTNDDQAATLIVKKVVINDNGGTLSEDDFDFKVNGGNDISFEADGQNDITVNAGTYTIVENPAAGYDTQYNNCRGVVIPNGGTVTCTITNDDIAPSLKLVKEVITDNGGNEDGGDWVLYADGTNEPFYGWGPVVGPNQVMAGVEYTLTESDNSFGYSASSWVCDGGNQNGNKITLALNENVTCTITNDDIAPKLTLIKDVVNNNGGNAQPDDFGLEVGGTSVLSGVSNEYSANSRLTIDEVGLEGYSFVEITGDEKCPKALGDTLILDEGDDITCTIKNDDIAPTITLIKNVINNNGGSAKPDDFNLTIGGNLVLSGSTNPVDANTPIALNETVFTGYDFVEISGDKGCPEILGGTVTLDEGQNISCTITNDDQIPHLTVIKTVSGGDMISSDFKIYVTGDNVSDSSFAGSETGTTVSLDAGSYIVSEDQITGYTPTFSEDCDGDIALGESKTCTITNTRDTGNISGFKFRDINGNGTIDSDDTTNPVSGVTILLSEYDLVHETISNTISDITDSFGFYNFDNVPTGYYLLCETVPTNSYQTYPNAGTLGATITDQDVCYVVLLKGDGGNVTNMNFANSPYEKIYGYKFNDLNGNGIKDESEVNLSGWTIFLDMNWDGILDSDEERRTTDVNGNYSFEGLVVDTYRVCEVAETDWKQTTTPTCYEPDFREIDDFEAIFGNQRIIAEIVIEKTNDKPSGVRIGEEITYTLKIKNTGNIDINNLEVIDILPGGFEYVLGTSTINDLSVSDPIITSGVMKWDAGDILGGEEIKITYKAKVLSSVFEGSTYKNFATCKGTYMSKEIYSDNVERFTTLSIQDEQESTPIESNVAYSIISIITGISYGGNIEGQVLGASIELPDTGSDTFLVVTAFIMLGIGIYLRKKYAKN